MLNSTTVFSNLEKEYLYFDLEKIKITDGIVYLNGLKKIKKKDDKLNLICYNFFVDSTKLLNEIDANKIYFLLNVENYKLIDLAANNYSNFARGEKKPIKDITENLEYVLFGIVQDFTSRGYNKIILHTNNKLKDNSILKYLAKLFNISLTIK